MYSLDCSYYTAEFETLDELIEASCIWIINNKSPLLIDLLFAEYVLVPLPKNTSAGVAVKATDVAPVVSVIPANGG